METHFSLSDAQLSASTGRGFVWSVSLSSTGRVFKVGTPRQAHALLWRHAANERQLPLYECFNGTRPSPFYLDVEYKPAPPHHQWTHQQQQIISRLAPMSIMPSMSQPVSDAECAHGTAWLLDQLPKALHTLLLPGAPVGTGMQSPVLYWAYCCT